MLLGQSIAITFLTLLRERQWAARNSIGFIRFWLLVILLTGSGYIFAQVNASTSRCLTDVIILPTDTVTCRFPRPAIIATGDQNYSYRWIDNNDIELGTGQSYPLDTGGEYRLIVVNTLDNCSDTLYTIVQQDQREPVFELNPTETFTCERDEVTVTAIIPDFDNDSLRIEWRTLGATLIGNEPDHLITDNQSYVAVVRNTTNGCGSRDTVQIGYDTVAPLVLVTPPALPELNCDTDSLLFTATSEQNVNYVWSSGVTNIQLSEIDSVYVYTPGLLTLTATDQENGCIDKQNISIESRDLTIGTITINYPDCSTTGMATVTVESINAEEGTYNLSINDETILINQPISLVTGSTYLLTATGENGCSNQLLIDVPVARSLATSIRTNQESYLTGDSILATIELTDTSNLQVDWFANGELVCENCLTFQLLATQSFILGVKVTDEFGCSASGIHTIIVSNAAKLFIPSAFSPNDDGINDRLLVFSGSQVQSIDEVSCYDRWGNQVYFSTDEEEISLGWGGTFQGEKAITGSYVIRVVYTSLSGESRSVYSFVNLLRTDD